jgi:putative nucleotidyltransferase with HDIG domain
MSAWWEAIAAAVGAVAGGAAAGALGEEFRGRVDLLPHMLVRLAARRIPRDLREDLAEEWLAELGTILEGTDALPVTRLIAGIRYALGVLRAAPAVACELGAPSRRLWFWVGWKHAAIAAVLGLPVAQVWRANSGNPAAAVLLALFVLPLLIACRVMAQARAEREAGEGAMKALCKTVETRDIYTFGHSQRVSRGAVMLAQELGIRGDRLEAIRHAGMLHDVGKLGIPARVLQKTGPMSETEYAEIQMHPLRGMEIVREIGTLDEAHAAIMHHHERIDGRGYPMGLAGDEIPEAARIVAIADAFDSMTSNRTYRSARSIAEAIAALQDGAGMQFDPVMVPAFTRALDREGWTLPAAPDDGEGRTW